MRIKDLGWNSKVVGVAGEVYRYDDKCFGVYTFDRGVARRLSRLTGAIRRQHGDRETVFSVPENQWIQIATILNLPTIAKFKRD